VAAPRLSITSLRAAIPFKLAVSFSDGTWGVFNAAPMLAERGEGTEPLRDRSYFAKVELVNGKPIWPNYFDISPLWLQEEMEKRGELERPRPERKRKL
jgi:hypothetical protein